MNTRKKITQMYQNLNITDIPKPFQAPRERFRSLNKIN